MERFIMHTAYVHRAVGFLSVPLSSSANIYRGTAEEFARVSATARTDWLLLSYR